MNAVRWALELGLPAHRHGPGFTATSKASERALRDSGVPRDEVFITTKFHPGANATRPPSWPAASSGSVVDQVDLYLVHWPQGGPTRAWPGMEAGTGARPCPFDRRLQFQRGRAEDGPGRRPPSPPSSTRCSSARSSTRAGCSKNAGKAGVVLEAYSPLGSGPVPFRPGREAGGRTAWARTPAQVPLRWCVQHSVPVIPKSTHRERIEENAGIFDFALSSG